MAIELTFRVTKMSTENTHGLDDQFKFGGKYNLTISEIEDGIAGNDKSEVVG